MTYDETELALLALPAYAGALVAEPSSLIDRDTATIAAHYRVVRFNDRLMIEVNEPYPHYIRFNKEHFERIAYPLLAGAKRSHISNVFRCLTYTAPNLSANDHLILFGDLRGSRAHLTVWDMDTLEIRNDIAPEDCVRRSPYNVRHGSTPVPFIMQLAGNDQDLYDDIMQSLAPLMMAKKPYGVIWWLGDNANGKDALIDALFRIFPDQLAALSLKTLIGGRYTLGLRNMLGNIAAGGIEHIDAMAVYNTIGAHETFSLHKYHSQAGVEVQANAHHIFSAATAPTFNHTRWGAASWRTHLIPFSQQRDTDRTRRFADSSIGQLIAEMCRYAVQIQERGHQYDWSATTRATKAKCFPESGAAKEARTLLNPTLTPFRW